MGQEGLLSDPMIVLGRLGAPYGVKGWVHVQSYTQPASNILRYKTWYLLAEDAQTPVTLLEGRCLAKGCVVALEGYKSPEAVAELRHAIVGVPRDSLPTLEEGVYYWADLIGMQVHNQTMDPIAEHMGRVVQVFEAGANDVLVIEPLKTKGLTQTVLIPFVMEDVIRAVDQEAQQIRLCWDEWFS